MSFWHQWNAHSCSLPLAAALNIEHLFSSGKNSMTTIPCAAVDNVICKHNWVVICGATIELDIEFSPLFEDVKDNRDTKFNCTLSGEHLPTAESSHTTITYRMCVTTPSHASPQHTWHSAQAHCCFQVLTARNAKNLSENSMTPTTHLCLITLITMNCTIRQQGA